MYSEAVFTLLARMNTISIAFIFLVGMVVYILFQVQKRDDFDFAEMLKTDGKPSASRLGMLVSLAVASWIMINTAVSDLSNNSTSSRLFDLFGVYLGVFAGAKVVEKGMDTWSKSQQQQFNPTKEDFKQTTQPDFEDTVPMKMDDVIDKRP